MSKEATGANGSRLGSSEYWSSINRSTVFGGLMQRDSEPNYYGTLQVIGVRANMMVDEIYEDLQNHIKLVRSIPSDHRSSLAKQVQALYDICRMGGVICSRSSECVSILNLSGLYVSINPFSNDAAVQNAVRKIKNNSDFFASECVDMIQQAADWSISFAAGSNEKKRAFLEDISQGKGKDFLQEVLDEYRSSSGTADTRGRCGYSIGSRDYRDYVERTVFRQELPTLGSYNYDGILKGALEVIADQLERDLTRNERENNYITDDTARSLKEAVRDLNRCDVSTGSSKSTIERLAWFVGGDPAKIRQLQSKLNELGIGERLEEDGVYGEKTKEAVDKAIEKFSELLSDPDKMRLLDQVVGATISALDFLSGSRGVMWKLHDILEKSRHGIQKLIWHLGAEYYLRPHSYDVAALLLEHSLESFPSNLHFSQSHWVTQKIIQSNGFRQFYRNLENQIQQSAPESTMTGSELIVFGNTGDTDLYLGFGTCTVYYTCRKNLSSVQIDFTIYDEYDFDRIRSISGDIEHLIKFNFSIGNLANDAGLFSQADSVISKYEVFAEFQKELY